MKKIIILVLTIGTLLLNGCVTKPENVTPVKNFQAKKYLGKWYEIARLENSFEKGMTKVYAEYSLNTDGTIKVVNSGVNPKTGQRSYAKGVAKFVENPAKAFLKVSFFGPFYGAYVVFKLDDNYKYAYVAGANENYLWLLSRTPVVPNKIKEDFIARANNLGYNTTQLVWVKQ